MVKLEAGKYYRTREGEKVGPMVTVRRGGDEWFHRDDPNGRTWAGSGRLTPTCGLVSHPSDIISEWPSTDFDPNWPHGHVTRDGRKARVICTDAKGPYPIVALIADGDDEWMRRYSVSGTCQSRCLDHDLINAPPPKREFWVNVYADGFAFGFGIREEADGSAEDGRIACIHVTEGDGL